MKKKEETKTGEETKKEGEKVEEKKEEKKVEPKAKVLRLPLTMKSTGIFYEMNEEEIKIASKM